MYFQDYPPGLTGVASEGLICEAKAAIQFLLCSGYANAQPIKRTVPLIAMLLELGEDLKVISERLGHSTITMTADTYGHVREGLQREASNKLNQVLKLDK